MIHELDYKHELHYLSSTVNGDRVRMDSSLVTTNRHIRYVFPRCIVYRAWLTCRARWTCIELGCPLADNYSTMIRRPQYFHSPNKNKFIQFSLVVQPQRYCLLIIFPAHTFVQAFLVDRVFAVYKCIAYLRFPTPSSIPLLHPCPRRG